MASLSNYVKKLLLKELFMPEKRFSCMCGGGSVAMLGDNLLMNNLCVIGSDGIRGITLRDTDLAEHILLQFAGDAIGAMERVLEQLHTCPEFKPGDIESDSWSKGHVNITMPSDCYVGNGRYLEVSVKDLLAAIAQAFVERCPTCGQELEGK